MKTQGLERMLVEFKHTPILAIGVNEEAPHGFKMAVLMPIRKLLQERPQWRQDLKDAICKAIDELVDTPLDDITVRGAGDGQ